MKIDQNNVIECCGNKIQLVEMFGRYTGGCPTCGEVRTLTAGVLEDIKAGRSTHIESGFLMDGDHDIPAYTVDFIVEYSDDVDIVTNGEDDDRCDRLRIFNVVQGREQEAIKRFLDEDGEDHYKSFKVLATKLQEKWLEHPIVENVGSLYK